MQSKKLITWNAVSYVVTLHQNRASTVAHDVFAQSLDARLFEFSSKVVPEVLVFDSWNVATRRGEYDGASSGSSRIRMADKQRLFEQLEVRQVTLVG